ncbi:MAG: thioredoxin domain-containing protein [Deltaproteobacteria bacterium]|nr:thioredoxin domain-containing protein [Deltaproteobacteria bacterium]
MTTPANAAKTTTTKAGPRGRPRTRHLRDDGSPRYTNHLSGQTSPYLLQHVHNPVEWWPWGDDAFAEARRRDVPVFLSVGYATCHWCHVMEEESFEDEDIAATMNALYVCVKVDREERPDVDATYMTAVQALTGRGGWPMSVWLTPDTRRPFFAGTYFPPRDGDRGARTGFQTVLVRLAEAWRERRDEVVSSAGQIASELASLSRAPRPADVPGADAVTDAVARFVDGRFDATWGGLRGAPKFPSTTPVRLLLRHAARNEGPHGARSRHLALTTLDRMIDGGLFDHAGGGFHRYSVDERWQVPHFEKMLYDNALLVPALVEAWQLTAEPRYERAARATLDFMATTLGHVDEHGRASAFLSATDADSATPDGHREEGWFFTWTPAELQDELGEADAAVVAAVFDVTPMGNFEHGRSVLWKKEPTAVVARRLGRTVDEVEAVIDRARPLLARARSERPAPLVDDKVLASWNGLAISAFARAAFAFDDAALAARARAALDFVLTRLRRDDDGGDGLSLWRSFRAGQARNDGVLDDHAFVCRACLDVFELDGDRRFLRAARALARTIARHFADDEAGGFFATAKGAEALLSREKPDRDGAEPSGNAVHAENLVRLALLLDDADARAAAGRTFRAFGQILQAHPHALAELALALDLDEHGKELVIARPAGADGGQAGAVDDDGRQLLSVLRRRFLPARVIVWRGPDDDDDDELSLARGRGCVDGKATVYVCEQGACRLPATTSRALLAALD